MGTPTPTAAATLHCTRDVLDGGVLFVVDVLQRDGSFARAYQRHVVLPPDRGAAMRMLRDAGTIHALAAGAVAATCAARLARAAASAGEPPPWRCGYQAD